MKNELNELKQQFSNLADRETKTNERVNDIIANLNDLHNINGNKIKNTEADLEDAAITIADFMAEYYLSQFEGGEEE